MLDRTSDDGTANSGGALRDALRRARAEAAEQTDVVVDLRTAEIARLELLREELLPVFAQVPREIDIFDLGLAPGERPRLFVDMVSFVEMDRDRRAYRFMRDGRHGRAAIAESERPEKIVEAVTSYVARRLIERERLLADDDRLAALGPAPLPARPSAGEAPPPPSATTEEPVPIVQQARSPAPAIAPRPRSGWGRFGRIMLAFIIGGLIGAVGVAVALVAIAKGIIPI